MCDRAAMTSVWVTAAGAWASVSAKKMRCGLVGPYPMGPGAFPRPSENDWSADTGTQMKWSFSGSPMRIDEPEISGLR